MPTTQPAATGGGIAGPYNQSIADHTWDGRTMVIQNHDAFAINEVGYLDTDNEVHLADADAIATAGGILLMATAAYAAHTAAAVFLVEGLIRNDDGFGGALTVGYTGTYYLSTTAGGILIKASKPSEVGDVARIVGFGFYANAPRIFFFCPSPNWIEL